MKALNMNEVQYVSGGLSSCWEGVIVGAVVGLAAGLVVGCCCTSGTLVIFTALVGAAIGGVVGAYIGDCF